MALLRNDSKFLDGKKIASENFVLDNINTHNNEENPHGVTKSHVGLSNVSNVLQASKEEFDSHINSSLHVSSLERENWNNKQESIIAGDHIVISGNTISATDTIYNTADLLHDGLMSKEDKNKLVRSSNTLDYIQLEEGDYFNLETLTSFMVTESKQHIPLVNTSTQGLMSGSDKIKLDGIAAGAQINPSIATKAEAETGTNNAKMMTALRVKEAINVHYNDKSNPHNVTKVQIGLSNVVDKLQATKDEFDTHTSNSTHITSLERNTWNAKQEEIIAGTNITKTGNTLSATDTKYNDATVSISGLMSMADKEKLDGIENGAQKNPTISTQSQAETGADNTTMLTPLRAKQAIEKLAPTPPLASTSANGLMASTDKSKLDGIATGAQVNPSIASQVEALTGTNNTNMMTPLRTKEAILESATIVVNHGTNSSMARPSGASVVYWIGTVEPTNATNNDLWVGGL